LSEVIIYTKTGCPYCKKAIEDYRAQGIEFTEVNVVKDKKAKQTVKEKFGATKVPVIVKDGTMVSAGYNGGG